MMLPTDGSKGGRAFITMSWLLLLSHMALGRQCGHKSQGDGQP